MNGEIRVSDEVRDVLDGIAVDADGIARIEAQLERPLYVSVNKVLESFGGKWNRSKKGHIFPEDVSAQDCIDDAKATGIVIDWKKANELFETPESIIEMMLDEVGVDDYDHVLEPSAGKGAIVRLLLLRGAKVTAIEKHEPYVDAMLKEFDAAIGDGTLRIIEQDFVSMRSGWDSSRVADYVVMNPPFSRNQDMMHVQHAMSFLKSGGQLVSVMGPGWKFRENRLARDFREMVATLGGEWRPLPNGTFKHTGTMVRSGLLRLRKK